MAGLQPSRALVKKRQLRKWYAKKGMTEVGELQKKDRLIRMFRLESFNTRRVVLAVCTSLDIARNIFPSAVAEIIASYAADMPPWKRNARYCTIIDLTSGDPMIDLS